MSVRKQAFSLRKWLVIQGVVMTFGGLSTPLRKMLTPFHLSVFVTSGLKSSRKPCLNTACPPKIMPDLPNSCKQAAESFNLTESFLSRAESHCVTPELIVVPL